MQAQMKEEDLTFRQFVRQQLASLAYASVAIALLLSVFLLISKGGALNIDVEFSRFDGLSLVVLLPAALCLAALVSSPLSYAIYCIKKKIKDR
ncbi:MAG: hypothetical protein Cons2KO_04220 [Congregibacter sp.]